MILFTIVLSLVLIYISFKLTFWKRQNLTTVYPHFLRLSSTFIEKAVQKHGKVFGTYRLLTPVLVITKPELINKVLLDNSDCFTERKICLKNENLFKNCIFFSKTKDFESQRNVIRKTFSINKNLIELSKHYMKSDSELLGMLNQILEIEPLIDFQTFLSMYSMRKHLSSCFGSAIDQKIKTKLFGYFQQIIQNESKTKSSKYLPKIFSFGSEDKELWKDFTQVVSEIYDNRKVEDCKNSLLFMLSDANDSIVMNKKQLIENSLMFCLMAYKTSLITLSHLIYNLAINQSIQQKLIKEVDKYVESQRSSRKLTDFECSLKSRLRYGLKPNDGNEETAKDGTKEELIKNEAIKEEATEEETTEKDTIKEEAIKEEVVKEDGITEGVTDEGESKEDVNGIQEEAAEEEVVDGETLEKERQEFLDAVNGLQYMDACIKESLRLNPPFPELRRTATKSVIIDDIFVPKSCQIIIPIIDVHRNPDIYDAPTKFKPERFLNGTTKIAPGAYIPFGDGPRNCSGIVPGILEMKLFLINILSNYRVVKCGQTKEFQYNRSNELFSKQTQNEVLVKFVKRNKSILD